jgi:hypothetical protein
VTYNPEVFESYIKIPDAVTKLIDRSMKKEIIRRTLKDIDIHVRYIFLASATPPNVVYHKAQRPTFLDWLLRRERIVEVTLSAKDFLLDPVFTGDESIRLFSDRWITTKGVSDEEGN